MNHAQELIIRRKAGTMYDTGGTAQDEQVAWNMAVAGDPVFAELALLPGARGAFRAGWIDAAKRLQEAKSYLYMRKR